LFQTCDKRQGRARWSRRPTGLFQAAQGEAMQTVEAATASGVTDAPSMKRALGPWHLTALGIGAIIGAGLFSLTGLAAGADAGPAVILAFVIAAIPAALTGFCYAELAAMFPQSGSCYTYVRYTAGDLAAWIIGWDLILEYAMGGAAVAAGFAGYVNSVLTAFGVPLPYWLLNGPLGDGDAGQPGIINLPAVLIILACSILLLRGVAESAWVNSVIVVVKLVVIVLFVALGLGSIQAANYTPFIPPHDPHTGGFGWPGVFRAASTIFFAYIGFETVSTAAQEARNPQRDMPIGMLGSLAICTILYIAFAVVLIGLVPYAELKDDPAAADTALTHTPYAWARVAISLGILGGFATSILTALYGQSRILTIMAADGMLPRPFAAIHPVWRTPWITIIVLFGFSAIFAGFLPLAITGDMTSIGTLLAFAAVSACVLRLRRREPERARPFRTPLVPILPVVGILCCLGLIGTFDGLALVRLIGWLVLGLIIRALMRLFRREAAHG
jgi:basic amino acid/polyamine antiporter, APA family